MCRYAVSADNVKIITFNSGNLFSVGINDSTAVVSNKVNEFREIISVKYRMKSDSCQKNTDRHRSLSAFLIDK